MTTQTTLIGAQLDELAKRMGYFPTTLEHEWVWLRANASQQCCRQCGRWRTKWVEQQSCERMQREGNAA